MLIIGVTGILGAGKSTVARFLSQKGAKVIDADKIVHRLLNIRTSTGKKLVKYFGRGVITEKGNIDRKKLAEIGFANHRNWSTLCKLIHPEVIKIIKREIKKGRLKNRRVLVIDAPLLIEAGLDKVVDYIILVKANLRDCFKRTKSKLGISRGDFRRRIGFQLSFKEKLCYADFVINNTKNLKFIERQVDEIWKKIISHKKS